MLAARPYLAAFRARPKSEQEAIDKVGLKAWEEWSKRNAATIVATDVMVGKTRRASPMRRTRSPAF